MAAKLEKTKTPGIYRRGGRYVVVFRDADGKQRWESARTLSGARDVKSKRTTQVNEGEFDQRSRVTLEEYALGWVDRYHGRGRRGFRESTRADYRRILEQYVVKHFGSSIKLTEITPVRVGQYIAWLADEKAQGKRAAEERHKAALGHREAKAAKLGIPIGELPVPVKEENPGPLALSDKSIRNYLGPLSACLASAVREGLIRTNPARDADLPHRPTADDVESEDVRAMSGEELSTVLALMPDTHRVFFWFLASTGLRISEAIAVQWRHLQLDGSAPHVKVRRGVVRGTLGPPKTRHSRRDVPLDHELVSALRKLRTDSEWPGDEDLVFSATNGKYLHVGNLRRRVLMPAREEADLSWVGFHTFRHTCASMLFGAGRNAVQVQHWLGHHSAAFTLSTYVHLLDGDIGEALALPAPGANKVQTGPTPLDTIEVEGVREELAA